MLPIDAAFIRGIAPKFSGSKATDQARIIDAVGPAFATTLDGYAIDTPLRIAHFMGQVTHECAGFVTTEEFASGAAYEGRKDLGNTQPGDGKRYKGRGLLQLTGRANYRTYGAALGLPLEDQPERAAEPVTSLIIACEYWKLRKINAPADADNLVAVTKLVNGGTNGLADRGTYLDKAKVALAKLQAAAVSEVQGKGAHPVLRRGTKGDGVALLQTLLAKAGVPLTIDAAFGPATELAVKTFQKARGLTVDGIVGAKTWAALENA